MINHVRNTVLTVLNKENRGFVTPQQFNSYAKHAQQLLFNQYLSEYSRMLAARNTRQISSDFLDRAEILQRKMEAFTEEAEINRTLNRWEKPDDLQYVVSLRYDDKELEQVPRHKERFLLSSSIAAPTENYPVYVDRGDNIIVHPDDLEGAVDIIYIRNPKDPKWTYTVVGENPIYNPNASDFQDFELSPDETVPLVVEILKLTGLSIREAEVTQAATGIDQVNTNKDS